MLRLSICPALLGRRMTAIADASECRPDPWLVIGVVFGRSGHERTRYPSLFMLRLFLPFREVAFSSCEMKGPLLVPSCLLLPPATDQAASSGESSFHQRSISHQHAELRGALHPQGKTPITGTTGTTGITSLLLVFIYLPLFISHLHVQLVSAFSHHPDQSKCYCVMWTSQLKLVSHGVPVGLKKLEP